MEGAGVTCAPDRSSQAAVASTLPSMLPSALSLLGSAKPTLTAEGRSSGTGPASRSSRTSETPTPSRLLPTPSANQYESEPEVWKARRARIKAQGINGNGFGLTLAMAVQDLTSSTVDIHASRSRSPGSAEGRTTPAISGLRSRDSFAFYDPESSSVRTSQGTLLSDSTGCSPTLPKWGWMCGGELFERPTLVPPTDGSGCSSLLHTPRAGETSDKTSRRGYFASLSSEMALLQTPSAADALDGHLSRGGSRSHELLLKGQVKALLPTPTTDDANNVTRASGIFDSLARVAHLLPTPRAQNGETRNSKVWARPLDQPQNLENALARLPGEPTSPRSDAGSTPPEPERHGQLTIGDG